MLFRSGTLTLSGTLAVANGGTGVTTSTGTGSVVLSTSPTLVTPALGTPTSGDFSTGTFTWPTFNQNTTGTAANITATSNSTLTTLSSLSLPGSQVTGNISGNAANITAYTINQNLATTSQVTHAGVTASLVGTASYATTAQQAEVARVTTNAAYYPVIVDSSNATAIPEALKSTANITMNPSTNTISATTVSGSIYASGSLYATGSIDGNVYANSNFVMDLNELGKTSARGTLVLPIYQPTYPVKGSVYVDFDGAKLYLYDGAGWVSIPIV